MAFFFYSMFFSRYFNNNIYYNTFWYKSYAKNILQFIYKYIKNISIENFRFFIYIYMFVYNFYI